MTPVKTILLLFVLGTAAVGCSTKLQAPKVSDGGGGTTPAAETVVGPGQTAVSYSVGGSDVSAEISVVPSQQTVSGAAVSGKISIQ